MPSWFLAPIAGLKLPTQRTDKEAYSYLVWNKYIIEDQAFSIVVSIPLSANTANSYLPSLSLACVAGKALPTLASRGVDGLVKFMESKKFAFCTYSCCFVEFS
jgi:hypothetical protein